MENPKKEIIWVVKQDYISVFDKKIMGISVLNVELAKSAGISFGAYGITEISPDISKCFPAILLTGDDIEDNFIISDYNLNTYHLGFNTDKTFEELNVLTVEELGEWVESFFSNIREGKK